MKVVFRTDASSVIGNGHLVRCLTLAKSLKKLNTECEFICRENKNDLFKEINKENFKLTLLPNLNNKTNKKKIIKTNWLGLNWKDDANQTINALKGYKIDWLIIDHYGIGREWEKKLRTYTQNIIVIDDLANRNHDCDILIDQNLIANFKNRYKNLLPNHCNTFLGPSFAILQNKYKDLHLVAQPRKNITKNILIYFGGTDQIRLIEMTLSSFYRLNRDDINLDIVISSKNSEISKIQKLIKNNKNIRIKKNLKSLAPLMLKADLAIGACGTTTWERCCLGLPSIVITIAEHQKLIAKELQKRQLIKWLGHHDSIKASSIYKALLSLIDQSQEKWSKECMLVTDGSGSEKIASIIALNSKTKLFIRSATINDEDLLLHWANDNLVRSNGFNSKIITKKIHSDWFKFRLNNPGICKIYILETNEKAPIGQVRFEKIDNRWYINYSLASFARGKKISSNLLDIAIKKFKKNNKNQLIAEVKEDNLSSRKVFEKIGFKQTFAIKNNFNILRYKL